ncbi:MAG: aminoacyl-tRNA hydrolase [Lentisphaerae bacterium GWF2_45_14]|nr:MAG: aminoacyl-tRNA hydrolase [Lentisphaerae bacterium GWF2_45_14]
MSVDSAHTLKLVAGLGNPGREYEGTRHNAGFMVIDSLLETLSGTFEKKEQCSSTFWEGRFRGSKLILQKPLTFMNLSGKAVASLCARKKISAPEMLLVYDDMDLPLGRMRIRKSGSGGGHNGVQSVIDEMGSQEFPRLRVGIGRSGGNNPQIDHVLSGFSSEESEIFEKVRKEAAEAVKFMLSRDIESAMNRYNNFDVSPSGEKKTEKIN